MSSHFDRRKFLKYGFIGTAGFLAASVPVKLDMSKGFNIAEGQAPSVGMSEAQAACGSSYECSGGGNQCGASYGCSGGGGKCGASYSCSGS